MQAQFCHSSHRYTTRDAFGPDEQTIDSPRVAAPLLGKIFVVGRCGGVLEARRLPAPPVTSSLLLLCCRESERGAEGERGFASSGGRQRKTTVRLKRERERRTQTRRAAADLPLRTTTNQARTLFPLIPMAPRPSTMAIQTDTRFSYSTHLSHVGARVHKCGWRTGGQGTLQ